MQWIPELALQHHASVIHNATIITAPGWTTYSARGMPSIGRLTVPQIKKIPGRISSELIFYFSQLRNVTRNAVLRIRFSGRDRCLNK
jgi:hypothetical protein